MEQPIGAGPGDGRGLTAVALAERYLRMWPDAQRRIVRRFEGRIATEAVIRELLTEIGALIDDWQAQFTTSE